MPEDFRLKAEPREALGSRNTQRLRQKGLVPANLYGFKKDGLNLTVSAEDVEKMVANGSRVVDVEVGGDVDKAVVQELQWDVFSTHVRHIDFKRVDPDAMTTTDVEVTLRGEPVGLKDGGQLRQKLKRVTVTCPDFRVPKAVVARVASLNVGDSLKVSDLEAPETVTINTDGDQVAVELFDPKKAE